MKINNFSNISFKNSSLVNKNYEKLQKDYKKQEIITHISIGIGIGVGAVSKLAKNKNFIKNGIIGYFISLIGLLTMHGIKELIEEKKEK